MPQTRRRSKKHSPRISEELFESLTRDGTIGEGKSKSIYVPPRVHDVAVLLAYFNPMRYKRSLKNALYVIHTLEKVGIPVFIAECTFNANKPQIPRPDIVLHSKTPMFYKEQLFNALEPIVPQRYTKLIFMDSDLIFEAPDWIDLVSNELEECDLIQPFEEGCWLHPDNISIRASRLSYGFAIAEDEPFTSPGRYHPGFAWAMRRDFFRAAGGFFDKKFLGGGDMAFAFSLIGEKGIEFAKTWVGNKGVRPEHIDYIEHMTSLDPRVGYIPIEVYHLFHGLRKNRNYWKRYTDVSALVNTPWKGYIILNKDGLYEFSHPTLIHHAKQYFATRDEDVALSKAMAPPGLKSEKIEDAASPEMNIEE
jgi:hypothetical protein